MKYNAISNPNPLTDHKVNYFVNYYQMVISLMGNSQFFEIENISSLSGKIIFQLEKNPAVQRTKYVSQHLEHPLLNPNCNFFNEYKGDSHVKLKLLLVAFNSLTSDKSKRKWVQQNENDLLTTFLKFKRYLKRYMVPKALKAIISYLKCPHDLEKHKNELQHYTKLIAYALYFELTVETDIKKRNILRDVIPRIMSKNPQEYPFSSKFESDNHENLENAKVAFLKSQTFEQQFIALENLLSNSALETYYFFRIKNINFTSGQHLILEDFEIFENESQRYKDLKQADISKSLRNDFLSNNDSPFAMVKLKSKIGGFVAKREALAKAKLWLDKLSKIWECEPIIDGTMVISSKDLKKYEISFTSLTESRTIFDFDINSAQNLFSNKFLTSGKPASTSKFRSYEHRFFAAYLENELSKMWAYIESTLYEGDAEAIKSKFVKIVSKRVLNSEKFSLKLLIVNYIMNNHSKDPFLANYSIKRNFMSHITQNLEDSDLNVLRTKSKDYFLNELLDLLDSIPNKNNELYLSRIIGDLHEQRNMIQHLGQCDVFTELKLLGIVPRLLIEYRQAIILAIKANPKLDYSSVISSF